MTGKGELVKMQFFSVSDEVVSLPKGAWAKSHRINIYWQGRHITSLSQGKYRAYLFPVYTPQGFAVTTASPIDHPHHNSIWIGTAHLHCHLPFSNQDNVFLKTQHKQKFYRSYVVLCRGLII